MFSLKRGDSGGNGAGAFRLVTSTRGPGVDKGEGKGTVGGRTVDKRRQKKKNGGIDLLGIKNQREKEEKRNMLSNCTKPEEAESNTILVDNFK